MASINKVILVGNIGKKEDLKVMTGGGAVLNLRVATSDKWKDKDTGEMKESTEWHNVSIFGKQAENVDKYLDKGALIYVEGTLKTRKWSDNEGKDRYTTEIVVNAGQGTVQFLDPPKKKEEQPF